MAEGIDRIQISADEVAGTIAARQALGEANEPAVIAAFLERTGYAIDARVDARVALQRVPAPPPMASVRKGDAGSFWLAICSLVLAIPPTAIATQFTSAVALIVVVATWIGIVAVNVSYHHHRRA